MKLEGKRVKRTKLIQTEKYVVAIEIEMVIPIDDQSEPCYESGTIRFLKEVKERAESGDIDWLTQQGGKIYESVDAA